MVKLTIGNSECHISGLNDKDFKTLRNLMSYKVTGSYYTQHQNPTRYLLDKRGTFPTGLLYILSKFRIDNKIKMLIIYNRVKPRIREVLFKLNLGYEPYPEQQEAADICLKRPRGIISAPTGVGKSAIAALIINNLQVNTLVVVPSLELKRQLTQSLKAAFGAGFVGDLGYPIAVENVDALDPKKDISKHYSAIIIDEFHHSGAATYRKLNKYAWTGVYYRYGLTATPFRSQDNEKLLLESVLSNKIYSISYQTAVDKGYIVPMNAFYVDLPKVKPKGNEYNWANMYKELVVDNTFRNEIIVDIMNRLKQSSISTLCLVKEIKHGDNLANIKDYPFINGMKDNTRELILMFTLNEYKQVIGTTGVLGEGVDTKPAEFIIIAGLGKSKNAFMQQVGRGFRKYPDKESCTVIIFKDRSHKWTLNHFREQCKILKDEYGVIPLKLEVDFSHLL